jgi:hypothetical protein
MVCLNSIGVSQESLARTPEASEVSVVVMHYRRTVCRLCSSRGNNKMIRAEQLPN